VHIENKLASGKFTPSSKIVGDKGAKFQGENDNKFMKSTLTW
jgi:hypothetical protein